MLNSLLDRLQVNDDMHFVTFDYVYVTKVVDISLQQYSFTNVLYWEQNNRLSALPNGFVGSEFDSEKVCLCQ